MKKLLFLFMIIFFVIRLSAQTGREVSGVIQDSIGKAIDGATIKLTSAKDTLTLRSNSEGVFVFKGVKTGTFVLEIISLGYQAATRRYLFNDITPKIVLQPINLKTRSNILDEVTITGTPAIRITEDTIEYRASDYKLKENDLVEDLLKKLDGVEVDKTGAITAQGKSVTRVRVNGKDFFNGDVKTATQQLPADIVDKVQIIDDYGDQANITGIKDGEPEKVLNIQLRADRNKGVFGKVDAGGGGESRHAFNTSANYFHDTRQLSFIGNLSNLTAGAFNFNGGGGRGGNGVGGGGFGGGGAAAGRGGGGGGGSGAAGSGIAGGANGIPPNVTSLGFNYRDAWSKKVESYGSYSYSSRNSNSITDRISQTVNRLGTIFSNTNGQSGSTTYNHRFNWNLEDHIDKANYLKISPSINFSKSNSDRNSSNSQTGAIIQDQLTKSGTNQIGPTYGGSILYDHIFAKKGRIFSLNLNLNNSNTNSDQDALTHILYYDPNGALKEDSLLHRIINTDNTRVNGGASMTYSEPLGQYSRLEFNYNINYAKYDNSRITNIADLSNVVKRIDSLSNIYNYSFTTNRIALNYRFTKPTYNYSLGLTAQPTLLTGYSISHNTTTHRSDFNMIPIARFVYKFSRTRTFNLNYSGRSSEPSYAEIQPVRDITNPQHPIVGNPDLKASFTNTVNASYNNFNSIKGSSFFINLAANFINNRIVSNIVLIPDILKSYKQETRYLNTNGYYTVNGNYSFNKPFAQRKYTITVNGSVNYNNNVFYTDNAKNTDKNWVITQRLRSQITPGDWVEFNPQVSYTYNINNYALPSSINSKIQTWSFNVDGRFFFLKSFIIGFDGSKRFNHGYTRSLNSNPFIVNTFVEKDFFKNKRGTLRFQSYDILDQSNTVQRSVSANSITDSQTNRLGRYFMLTASIRMEKFNRPPARGQRGPGQRPGGGMQRGGGGPRGGGGFGGGGGRGGGR